MAEVVSTPADLAGLVEGLLHEPTVAIDTESNSFFGYPERLCLVQVATRTEDWVVDPLAIEEMAPLERLFTAPEVVKIIHAADNDARVIDREWGFRLKNVFDTSIAGRFCGFERSGLDTVLREGIGVIIQKNKSLQRADWSIRPLSARALAYAVDDVAHLVELREALMERLEGLGRAAWVDEECERIESVRFSPPDPPDVAFLSMKGSRDLDEQGLAVLKELYVYREAEGRRRDAPPFRILGNSVLLHLAQKPKSDLARVPGLTLIVRRRLGDDLREALKRGMAAPPIERPKPPYSLDMRLTKEQMTLLKALKAWRIELGDELKMDPALLWPMASMERLAREPDALADELENSTLIRRWQREEFGESLRQKLTGL